MSCHILSNTLECIQYISITIHCYSYSIAYKCAYIFIFLILYFLLIFILFSLPLCFLAWIEQPYRDLISPWRMCERAFLILILQRVKQVKDFLLFRRNSSTFSKWVETDVDADLHCSQIFYFSFMDHLDVSCWWWHLKCFDSVDTFIFCPG